MMMMIIIIIIIINEACVPGAARRTWRPTRPASCSASPADCGARTTWCRWRGRRKARPPARTCPSSSLAPARPPSAGSPPCVTSRPAHISNVRKIHRFPSSTLIIFITSSMKNLAEGTRQTHTSAIPYVVTSEHHVP